MRNLVKGNTVTINKFVWPAELQRAAEAGEDDGMVTFDRVPLSPDIDLGKLVKAVFIDTETTGLGPNAEIIEVAAVSFSFHKETGDLHWIGEAFVGLQEPSCEIPADTTAINGITIDMVRGHHIDWAHVRSILASADMVIAHNAKFDRPLVEAALRNAKQPPVETPWACSMAQVEWKSKGIPSNSLEVICAWHGVWYEAHRAEVDIGAGIYALQKSGQLATLYKRLHDKVYEVRAIQAPYEANQAILKPRKYSWNGDGKYWAIRFKTEDEAKAEMEFLQDNVYTPYKIRPSRAVMVAIDPSRG